MINRPSAVLTAAILVGFLMGVAAAPAAAQPQVILRVDYTDFLDSDPLTNSVTFIGVSGAFPEATVTDNGNFPDLALRDFFTSNQTGTSVTSATMETLADFMGRTYGLLFLSGVFSDPPFADIPPTSLGLIATNLAHHDFDVGEPALVGESTFDLTGMGFTSVDFGTGGQVYAQDFPFVRIGRWEAVLPPPVLRVDYTDFLDGDPLTNSITFTGVSDAFPEVTVTDNGSLPELDLRDFFTSSQAGSGVTSATTETLADFMGRTYGQLFLSGHFSADPIADIPPTSLGLLATNGTHHDFDVGQTALVGGSTFDLTGMGFTGADFATGGQVYAQDFPFVRIGKWEAVLPPPALILWVDYTDFLDGDPLTNSVTLTGVGGASPEVTVTDNGNFPELDLRDFFTSNQTGTDVTSATTETLADFMGRTYGWLFLSGTFSAPPVADISPTSLGLIATNAAHHDFDVGETALEGESTFDLTGMGFTGNDFGLGGHVYAQDFPFVRIGRWKSVVPTAAGPVPSRSFSARVFPNPFNPATRVSFFLPQDAMVTARVFDVQGRQVDSILEEETLLAGGHQLVYRSAQPSGVYFLRIEAGGRAQAVKMTLVK